MKTTTRKQTTKTLKVKAIKEAALSTEAELRAVINKAPVKVLSKIDINGKEVPLLFNSLAAEYYAKVSKQFELSTDTLSVGHYVNIIYSGVKAYERLNGEPKEPVEFADVFYTVEEMILNTKGQIKVAELAKDFMSCKAVLSMLLNHVLLNQSN